MRTDAFRKAMDAMALKAEAAGWRFNSIKMVWCHDQHARQYTNLMQLFEKHIQQNGTAQ